MEGVVLLRGLGLPNERALLHELATVMTQAPVRLGRLSPKRARCQRTQAKK
jgi:hypothetical protein